MGRTTRRAIEVAAILVAISVICFLRAAGTLLIIDQPAKADVIMVLAGDQNEVRFNRGVQLLREGYAPHLQVDANSTFTYFGKTNEQSAEEFIATAPADLKGRLSVCGTPAVSTREEFLDAQPCLQRQRARTILIVTSDFHTRRSLDTARRAAPQFEWSVAAAPTELSQGPWWRNRAAAKNVLEEWQKFLWWKLVDSHLRGR